MKKVFVLIALFFTVVPVAFVLYKAGGIDTWQGVMPRGTTDSLYYYARIHEVADGHLFIGNPYIYEYRQGYPPAAFLPDAVSALPLLVGVPFPIATVLNMFVWTSVFLLLAYALFSMLGMPRYFALAWSVFSFIISYTFMLRPNAMQIVFPVFLAFLLALLWYLRDPQSKKRAVLLSVSSALPFYVYTYLAYVVLVTLGIVFLFFLVKRRFTELTTLIISGVVSGFLLIPFAIFTWFQLQGPYYLETLTRLGLVETHIPSMESFFYGRWIVVALLALALIWKFFPKVCSVISSQYLFWFATGFSLLACLFLNVVTGAELTLGVHVGRFVILWMTIALGTLLHAVVLLACERWGTWTGFALSDIKTKLFGVIRGWAGAGFVAIAILALILSAGVARNVPRGFQFFEFDEKKGQKLAELQLMAKPMNWLEENVKEESVIWANPTVSQYVPIMTKHYVLFHESAVLHNIPNAELEERYLLSNSFNLVSTSTLREDFPRYVGSGPSKDQPRVENLRVDLCTLVGKIQKGKICPEYTDEFLMRGEAYFEELVKRSVVIRKDQKNLLQKYSVAYLVVDRERDTVPTALPIKKAVYDDGRFAILALPL